MNAIGQTQYAALCTHICFSKAERCEQLAVFEILSDQSHDLGTSGEHVSVAQKPTGSVG